MPSLRGAHGRFLRRTGAFHPEVLLFDLTHRCNSRCGGCGFREPEPGELDAARWVALAREGAAMGFGEVVITGGEPLAHPDITAILDSVASVLPVSLNTNGLLLAARADLVHRTCRRVYVSLDAATEDTYARIRGLRGLGPVLRGVEALRAGGGGVGRGGVYIHARVTIWSENADQLEAIVALAVATGFDAVSFLAPDTTSEGFGERTRTGGAPSDRARPPDAAAVERIAASLARLRTHPLLEQSDRALDRVLGLLRGERRAPTCLAPWTSALVDPTGRLRHCFFLPSESDTGEGLRAAVTGNRPARRALDLAANPTCQRCVCWRG